MIQQEKQADVKVTDFAVMIAIINSLMLIAALQVLTTQNPKASYPVDQLYLELCVSQTTPEELLDPLYTCQINSVSITNYAITSLFISLINITISLVIMPIGHWLLQIKRSRVFYHDLCFNRSKALASKITEVLLFGACVSSVVGMFILSLMAFQLTNVAKTNYAYPPGYFTVPGTLLYTKIQEVLDDLNSTITSGGVVVGSDFQELTNSFTELSIPFIVIMLVVVGFPYVFAVVSILVALTPLGPRCERPETKRETEHLVRPVFSRIDPHEDQYTLRERSMRSCRCKSLKYLDRLLGVFEHDYDYQSTDSDCYHEYIEVDEVALPDEETENTLSAEAVIMKPLVGEPYPAWIKRVKGKVVIERRGQSLSTKGL